ncbi:MAG: hypothetical protein IPP94_04640 [Ignavibacteria bacterium]|nr:hypothetical protein [Ignavibacteria bacterium]
MTISARFLLSLLVFAAASGAARAQFDQATSKALLEEYSLQLFGNNATGYMGPLVVVSNVGAHHGFFHSAKMSKKNELRFEISIQSVYTTVREDERTFTGTLPIDTLPGDSDVLRLFKLLALVPARANGELSDRITTATVFGGQGTWFRVPKKYLFFVPAEQLKNIPDSLQLTNGTNQQTVFAAVPQLRIGTWKSTDMLLRYIPPVTFDKNVGKFSFFGVAFRHGFTNWFRQPIVDAAFEASYQRSTINNIVGTTKAELDATTDMWSVNVQASRRFGWFEPYVGISYENLYSNGTYKFTLPANIKEQIGYDIDPQTAAISLDDHAFKGTIGVAAIIGPVDVFLSAGISKHFIIGGGVSYAFHVPTGR